MEETGAVVWSRLTKNFSKDTEYFFRSQENVPLMLKNK